MYWVKFVSTSFSLIYSISFFTVEDCVDLKSWQYWFIRLYLDYSLSLFSILHPTTRLIIHTTMHYPYGSFAFSRCDHAVTQSHSNIRMYVNCLNSLFEVCVWSLPDSFIRRVPLILSMRNSYILCVIQFSDFVLFDTALISIISLEIISGLKFQIL